MRLSMQMARNLRVGKFSIGRLHLTLPRSLPSSWPLRWLAGSVLFTVIHSLSFSSSTPFRHLQEWPPELRLREWWVFLFKLIRARDCGDGELLQLQWCPAHNWDHLPVECVSDEMLQARGLVVAIFFQPMARKLALTLMVEGALCKEPSGLADFKSLYPPQNWECVATAVLMFGSPTTRGRSLEDWYYLAVWPLVAAWSGFRDDPRNPEKKLAKVQKPPAKTFFPVFKPIRFIA